METNTLTTAEPRADSTADCVSCPFCALLCDDVSLPVRSDSTPVPEPACAKAEAGFRLAWASTEASPRLRGQLTDWGTAMAQARHLLEAARLPLFHGLLGDLIDSRSAWMMAARFGGVVDHRDGEAVARNLAVYQDSGWIATSLGEVRNRADLVIWVGQPVSEPLPRLREKLLEPRDRLHTSDPATELQLGADPLQQLDQTRALLRGHPLPDADPDTGELRGKLAEANYPVFIVGELNTPDAELILRACVELVTDINETSRAALLLMSTGLGDVTAQLSGAWHNGFGIRTSMARGYPQQDLRRYAGQRMLDDGQSDLLVWISSLSAEPPPSTRQPQIVFGHPGMAFPDTPPEVYLPVAVPGVHRAGFLHRGDGFRLVPLQQILRTELPTTASLCRELLNASDGGPAAC